jgi:hypothetical protein
MPRLASRGLLAVSALFAVAAPAVAQTPVQKLQLVALESLKGLTWQTLASDAQGDVLHPRLPDAKELSYALDTKAGLVWFKVSSYEPLPERFFGINVAVDNDGNQDNGLPWWGTNKIKLDRLASAYLFKGEGYWQGTAGVSDGEGAGRFLFSTLSPDVKVALDRERQAILLGIPRTSLGSVTSVRVIATVGSMMANNDDVPNEGMATVKLTP